MNLLFQSGDSLVAVPVTFEIQDGLQTSDVNSATLGDKMSGLCGAYMKAGSHVILEAYFASKKLIKQFRPDSIHLITRVKINTVAKNPLPLSARKKGSGRPRTWGSKLELQTLFNDPTSLRTESLFQLFLYGKKQKASYRTIDLHLRLSRKFSPFFGVLWLGVKPRILLSMDLYLAGVEIIIAYSWLFKIEVTFRTLIELLSGFKYWLWMKKMPSYSREPKNMNIKDYSQDKDRINLQDKIEAFERFVNLNALVLGILQILS